MSDTSYTDPAARYVSRLAGYDQRLQLLERSHVHQPDTPVGAIVDWPGQTLPPTWALCDGTQLLAAQYPDLFAVIGYGYGGTGAYFKLPDLRSRFTLGAGVGAAGHTNRALGATGGLETVSLNANQTGAHFHVAAMTTGGASPGHTHAVTGATAGGSVGHTHGFTSGGASGVHQHNLAGAAFVGVQYQGGFTGTVFGAGAGALTDANNADHTHAGTTGGVSADHSHAINLAATGGVSADHAHSFNGNTDGGACNSAAHENMPPYIALNKIIRVAADTAALAALTVIERT
jgi:microcystin-dependent protein